MTFSRILIIAGLAGATLALPAPAQQPSPRGPPCADRSHVAGQLSEMFGERRVGSGLAENGVLFELYVGPSGSWTLLATAPTGTTCLLGAGEAWEPVPEPDAYAAR